MELEKKGPAIPAIQEEEEEFYSDTASEMESRLPHVTFQDSGLGSPDYAPRSPVISERSLAMHIERYDVVYSPFSPTPMDEDDDDDDPQGDEIKAVLTKAAEQLSNTREGDAIQAGTSAGSKTAPQIGAQNSQTKPLPRRGETEIQTDGVRIPAITNGSFLTHGEELNRLWGEIIRENFCEGGHQCNVPEHKKMGPLAPMHEAIPDDVRYDLCWALTLAVTSAEGNLRFCLLCRGCNVMVAGELPKMLRHVLENHGQELHENFDLKVIAANLRVLRHLNTSYTIACPVFRCGFNTKTEEEAYIHHTIAHERIGTKHMLACIFCSEPLLGRSLEEHVKEKNIGGPQDAYHDLSCCGLTISTIGHWLAHNMAHHTIAFLSKLFEDTRKAMSNAMYNNAACVYWAKTVPIIVINEETNVKVPDLFDQEFGDLIFLVNAQMIVEHVLEKYNNSSKAYKIMNQYDDHTGVELRKIRQEIVEEGLVMSINNLFDEVETYNTTDWAKDLQSYTEIGRAQGRRIQEHCDRCLDTKSHEDTPTMCMDRRKHQSVASRIITFGNVSQYGEYDGILIGKAKGPFDMKPYGRTKWLNCSSYCQNEKYATLYKISENGKRVQFYNDIFMHIETILLTIKPTSDVPVVLDFFLATPEKHSEEDIYWQAHAYIAQLLKLRNKYKVNMIIMCPLPNWEQKMSTKTYLLETKTAQTIGAIFAKVAMKYKVTAIPTVGILENQPIVREGDDECLGYWSAATCMEGYAAPREISTGHSAESSTGGKRSSWTWSLRQRSAQRASSRTGRSSKKRASARGKTRRRATHTRGWSWPKRRSADWIFKQVKI
jgi:hypothetical protein